MHVSWSLLAMSSSTVHKCLAFTWSRSSTRLDYFKKYSVSDPIIGIRECKHMQLMIYGPIIKTIIGVVSSPDKIGCEVLSYTRYRRASVDPQAVRTYPEPIIVS